ncbi:hypothetical protein B5M50_00980 [candidate division KSB1 bacterium 4484_219]|nr:MAG: hypothetical protein B5M50_00980 [candidate division KSB1 bacterium 4484_219]
MGSLGLSENVQIGERRFYVQSLFQPEGKKIISQIFENGSLLDTREQSIDASVEETEYRTLLEQFHRQVVTELDLLFYIHKKVKKALHAPSSNKLGLIFLKKNLVPEAIDSFLDAIAIDDKFIDAYKNLGIAYLRAGWQDDAVQILTKAVQLAPEFPDLHNYLGLAYLRSGNYAEAIHEVEEAICINENYSEAHFTLGLIYLTSIVKAPQEDSLLPLSVREKKALFHLRKSIDLNPHLESSDYRQALKEFQNSNFSQSLDLLNRCHQNGIEFESLYEHEFYLNFMFGGKSKDERSINDYIYKLQEQMKKYSNYPDLHNHLGVAYLIQCRNLFLKALQEFRQALKINPRYKQAQKNLKLAENEGKGLLILLRALLK